MLPDQLAEGRGASLAPPPSQQPAGIACVLDAGLSLRPTGLHWALALAGVVPTWLTQTHWSIVEDPDFFLRDARFLPWIAGHERANGAEDAFALTVEAWRTARQELGFESRRDLYWHGFGRVGSVVPKDGDAALIDRIDALAAGFDGRRVGGGLGVEPVVDSARDTLALAAGLGARHTVALSPSATEDGEAPPLVRELEGVRICCTRLAGGRLRQAVGRPLLEALVASGLAVALASARQRVLALAVVAPRACLLPVRRDEDLDWDEAPGAVEAALWDDAAAVCWELP